MENAWREAAFYQVLFNTISRNVFSILNWHEDTYHYYAGPSRDQRMSFCMTTGNRHKGTRGGADDDIPLLIVKISLDYVI